MVVALLHHATVSPAGIFCFALSVPSGQIASLAVSVPVVVVVGLQFLSAGTGLPANLVPSGQMSAWVVV